MADWSAFLDKFLRDTELLVLAGAGSISHDEEMTWANEQYDAFAESRRLEAEAMAEARGANAIAMGVTIVLAEEKEAAAPTELLRPGRHAPRVLPK